MNDRELLARISAAVDDAFDSWAGRPSASNIMDKIRDVVSPAPEAGRTGDSLPPLKCAVCDEEIHATHAGVHVTAHIACSSKLKAALDTFNEEAPEAGSVPAPVPYDEHEREMGKLIDERDAYHDKLDEFVEAVGGIEACGEHSSANDPWARALELVEEKFSETPAAPPSRAETPTVEECFKVFMDARDAKKRELEDGGRCLPLGFSPATDAAGIAAVRALCLTARPEGMDAAPFDFHAHLERQREWSRRTFGPDYSYKRILDHIRKELVEIEAKPYDLNEWIDVVLLALDGAWRSGNDPVGIVSALVGKQIRNEGRVWPDWRTAPADKAIEHTKPAPSPVARETTRDADEAVNDLRAAEFVVYHAVKSGQRVAPEVLEAIPKAIERIEAARSSLPSGEAGVDVKTSAACRALRLYLAEHYGWCSPHGMSLEWCSGWDAEMAAALKAQGVPTRATKEE